MTTKRPNTGFRSIGWNTLCRLADKNMDAPYVEYRFSNGKTFKKDPKRTS